MRGAKSLERMPKSYNSYASSKYPFHSYVVIAELVPAIHLSSGVGLRAREAVLS
ncbi:MAG: hypothetical protein P1U50_07495 [Parvibaculaceae bacterium]|nr:hypothetical protein [Parvibaculaceae bacterium]